MVFPLSPKFDTILTSSCQQREVRVNAKTHVVRIPRGLWAKVATRRRTDRDMVQSRLSMTRAVEVLIQEAIAIRAHRSGESR